MVHQAVSINIYVRHPIAGPVITNKQKSSLRQIHDPVLLSLKVEVICYINFLAYQELVLAYQELKLTFHSHNNQVYILL